MKAFYNLPTARPNLRTLGLPVYHQPPVVVAPAPRAKENISPERVAHVMRLIGALLNVEESGEYLKNTPRFSGLLQSDLHRLSKLGRSINARFLAEFSESDSHLVDTMNRCGNLLNRLSLLILHVPEEVADEAATAAADVIEKYHASTFKS